MRRARLAGIWSPARRRYAGGALASALGTVLLFAALAGWAGATYAALYLLVVGVAVLVPAAVAFQVLGGQALVGLLLAGGDDPPLLVLALMLAGVVLSAELLANVARLDTPLTDARGEPVSRVGGAALVAAGVFVGVGMVAALPGPGGLVAVFVASVACFALASKMIHGRGDAVDAP